MAAKGAHTSNETAPEKHLSTLTFKAGDEEKYRPQVEFKGVWMTARLDGDGCRVKAVALARYGDREVTIDITVPQEVADGIEKALYSAGQDLLPEAAAAAERAAMQAFMAAVSRKEEGFA